MTTCGQKIIIGSAVNLSNKNNLKLYLGCQRGSGINKGVSPECCLLDNAGCNQGESLLWVLLSRVLV